MFLLTYCFQFENKKYVSIFFSLIKKSKKSNIVLYLFYHNYLCIFLQFNLASTL